ncbi:hypothetical protein [Lysobacter sp. A289]
MKPAIDSAARRRTAYILSFVLFATVLTLAASAWAQSTKSEWPTTEWVVKGPPKDTFVNQARGMFGGEAPLSTPRGERGRIAAKHKKILEAASIWYKSRGFPAPVQWTESWDLHVEPGEAYMATLKEDATDTSSGHTSDGFMKLTSNAGFLAADTPKWKLMEASAVHEIYHGIQQNMSPSLTAWSETTRAGNPECRGDGPTDWLSEGTAAMIQIRWLEGRGRGSWGHPFKGSHRIAWVRHFDQPLHRGAIPPEHRAKSETASWACDYGTWYFWYAIGEMIGRDETERIAYTRYLFTDGAQPWDDGGIANVDAGLKETASDYDAIRPYRGGLYDLYPQFVAQYLTDDRFYGKLEEVELGTPGLYRTSSAQSGGPLGPLATRAWRVRVPLPRDAIRAPHNVRFTVDALEGTGRDDLHLIVDEHVVPRPVDPTAPYADVQRIYSATPAVDGAVEYLVRVANVAEEATETADAGFSLRVEVDGFYGNDVSTELTAGDIDAVSGELPPGFSVRGPGPWTCTGNDKSRAVFDFVTPDELGRDVGRLLPGLASSTKNNLDKVAIMLKRMKKAGVPTGGVTQDQLALIRKKADGALAAARPMIQPKADAAADKVRSGRTSTIAATFVGQNAGAECQMILGATLAGRDGGAQILPRSVNEGRTSEDPAPSFDVGVYSAKALEVMRSPRPGPDPLDGWQACSMNDTEREDARQRAATDDCPVVICSPGRLTLEAAEQGRIAGSFQFEVVRWGERGSGQCRKLLGRENVTGYFSAHSTDDSKDDNSLGGLGVGIGSGSPITPGAPIL